MQPIRQLEEILRTHSSEDCFLYSIDSLKCFFPDMHLDTFLKLISRASKAGLLERVAKGIYLYPRVTYCSSDVLYLVAGIAREEYFNYISLESVLASWSVISQQLMNCITIMTTGRSGVIDCGRFGHIEFTHTEKPLTSILQHLHQNPATGFNEADLELAMLDMRSCHHSFDLVDMEMYETIMEELHHGK